MELNSETIYEVTPRELAKCLEEDFCAHLVPFVKGPPGCGKSSIFQQVANKLRLKMIDLRLSTCAPEDLTGLPKFNEQGYAVFSPFAELFPLEDTPLPEGYDGWMIFLDEMNSAEEDVQAASYKLILDRMTGQHKLHPNVVIGAAGNRDIDRAITNPIGTALQSRVSHYTLKVDYNDWQEDVAIPECYDSRILAYLGRYPSKLDDFNPGHNNETFTCPRTWEFVNRFVKANEEPGKPIDSRRANRYVGKITPEVATDFITFTQVFQSLTDPKDIIRDPHGCKIPTAPNEQWANIAAMTEIVNKDNFEQFAIYANRHTMDMRVLFFRTTMIRQPRLRAHPAFAKAMTELDKYLNR